MKRHKKGITKSYFLSMDSVEFKVQLVSFAIHKHHLKKKMAVQTPRLRFEGWLC